MPKHFLDFHSATQQFGEVQYRLNYVREKFKYHCENLYKKDLYSHYGCVNAIDFSNDGDHLVSANICVYKKKYRAAFPKRKHGGDDKRVLLWNCNEITQQENPQPICMKTTHLSNIFCTTFDADKEHIFSSGNDEKVFRHNIERQECVNTYAFDEPIYAVDTPSNESCIFITAGEDGTIQLCDVRAATGRKRIAFSAGSFHSVSIHPVETRIVASANSLDGVALWDVRYPEKSLICYGSLSQSKRPVSAMSVRFNYTGRQIFSLIRKHGPVMYDIHGIKRPIEFRQEGYSNVCTMKSACFAGEKDEFIVCGSDDFNVYIWKVPEENSSETVEVSAHLTLRGHRSIVNQVRYNRYQHLLVSAGVEKVMKIWSPLPMVSCHGDVTGDEHFVKRSTYSHDDYMRLLIQSGHMTHDYETENTEEDSRMLAFFDSLVERTKNDIHSTDDDDYDGDGDGNNRVNNILDLLLDQVNDSSDEHVEDPESNDAFGVSISELRRIFRTNGTQHRDGHASIPTVFTHERYDDESSDRLHRNEYSNIPSVLSREQSSDGLHSNEYSSVPNAYINERYNELGDVSHRIDCAATVPSEHINEQSNELSIDSHHPHHPECANVSYVFTDNEHNSIIDDRQQVSIMQGGGCVSSNNRKEEDTNARNSSSEHSDSSNDEQNTVFRKRRTFKKRNYRKK